MFKTVLNTYDIDDVDYMMLRINSSSNHTLYKNMFDKNFVQIFHYLVGELY